MQKSVQIFIVSINTEDSMNIFSVYTALKTGIIRSFQLFFFLILNKVHQKYIHTLFLI